MTDAAPRERHDGMNGADPMLDSSWASRQGQGQGSSFCMIATTRDRDESCLLQQPKLRLDLDVGLAKLCRHPLAPR